METKTYYLRGDYGSPEHYFSTANCLSIAVTESGERNAASLQDAVLMVEKSVSEQLGTTGRWLYLVIVEC
jgi:hypothetical protein